MYYLGSSLCGLRFGKLLLRRAPGLRGGGSGGKNTSSGSSLSSKLDSVTGKMK